MAYSLNKWIANERKPVKRSRWLPPFLGLMMVALAVNGVLEAFDRGDDAHRFPDLMMFWLPVLLVSFMSPFGRGAWIGPRATQAFDEFERAALARATTSSYAVMMLLLMALFAWLWLAGVNGWPAPSNPHAWSSLGLAVIFIGLVLPIFFAELMVPLPPINDATEE